MFHNFLTDDSIILVDNVPTDFYNVVDIILWFFVPVCNSGTYHFSITLDMLQNLASEFKACRRSLKSVTVVRSLLVSSVVSVAVR